LEQINAVYQDGEVVNHASLVKYGFLKGKSHGIKILGNGEATKKVKYEVDAISKSAKEKLQNSKSSLTLLK
jgi:large subunit ribosomal protein L15